MLVLYLVGFYLLCKIAECGLAKLWKRFTNRDPLGNVISKDIVVTQATMTSNMDDEIDNSRNRNRTRTNQSIVQISSSEPIVLPPNYERWNEMEKARWITLIAVDTMFRTVSPLIQLLVQRQDTGSKKRK